MSSQRTSAAAHLDRLVRLETGALSDAELLRAFVHQRHQAALSAIVERHAGMVWGVCRRILTRHQDAEDAFQATFLVLVRKAAAVRDGARLANWLYGVAQQTAVRQRAVAAKLQRRERPVIDLLETPAPALESQAELHLVLDRELTQLPDKYRTLIVLCDLEGRTRKEVARQLRCPEGTVAGRLARARDLLARRLRRCGLAAFTGAALAGAATEAPAAELVSATARAVGSISTGTAATAATAALPARVATLAEGVLQAMLLSKLKVAFALVLLTVVALVGLAQGVAAGWPGDRDPGDSSGQVSNPQANDVPAAATKNQPDPKAPDPAPQSRPLTLDEVNAKMLRDPGNRFDVELVGRTDGVVSGAELYFYDSALDAAAVHAGLVKPGEKAIITVTVVKCPKSGMGSTRNGVKSNRWDGARAGDTALLLQRRDAKAADDPKAEQPPAKDGKKVVRQPGALSLDDARAKVGKFVTVEFRVATARMAWTTGFGQAESFIVTFSPVDDGKDAGDFQLCLTSKAVTQLRKLGLVDEHARKPAAYFEGKTVRLTGQIEAWDDRDRKGVKLYRLCVWDLDHLEVVADQ